MFSASPELQIGTEDTYLSRWLYYANWNVEGAFIAIDKYFEFKAHNPSWFNNLKNIDELKDLIINVKTRYVLKKRDVHGRIVIVQLLSKCF